MFLNETGEIQMIIGIDMGGTHTDGVVVDRGEIIKTAKKTTDRQCLLTTIWSILQELLEGLDKKKIFRINLSTTVSTNAIVENKKSSVGMIIQCGPGMSYDFSSAGDQIELISGYIDHRGTAVSEVPEAEVHRIKNSFITNKIESIGIVSKFSNRNPGHEKQISKILEDSFGTITLGHSLSGKLNFPRRVHTAYLNSSVHATFKYFADSFEESLKKEGWTPRETHLPRLFYRVQRPVRWGLALFFQKTKTVYSWISAGRQLTSFSLRMGFIYLNH
jgi:N-methylhydantoinase A/oxoprolinase/acetone carboxylase beta subunit